MRECGAMKSGERYLPSFGDVFYGKDVYLQNFVSVKVGLREGDYTMLNDRTYLCSFTNIGHNCIIGKDCFVAPGCKVLGNCVIGDHVYLGANSVITPNCNIGCWVKVRAGEVVKNNIPSHTYYGKDGKLAENWFGKK